MEELGFAVIEHKFICDHPAFDIANATFNAVNAGIGFVWPECKVELRVISIYHGIKIVSFNDVFNRR